MTGFPPAPRPRVSFWPSWIRCQSTGLQQGLSIGVQYAKTNLAEIGGDHPIHCVAAPTPDSDHLDSG
jgi:hypothetical protein